MYTLCEEVDPKRLNKKALEALIKGGAFDCFDLPRSNMFGAIEFYKKATAAGIKPIIGCEAYVAGGSRFESSTGGSGKGGDIAVAASESFRAAGTSVIRRLGFCGASTGSTRRSVSSNARGWSAP